MYQLTAYSFVAATFTRQSTMAALDIAVDASNSSNIWCVGSKIPNRQCTRYHSSNGCSINLGWPETLQDTWASRRLITRYRHLRQSIRRPAFALGLAQQYIQGCGRHQWARLPRRRYAKYAPAVDCGRLWPAARLDRNEQESVWADPHNKHIF